MPGSHKFVGLDKDGVEIWRMEVYTGTRPDGRPDRHKRNFHGTETQCLKAKAMFYAEKMRQKRAGQLAATRMTVGQWAEEWLRLLRQNERSPNTVRFYRELLHNRILPALGALPLAELTPRHIQVWLEQMATQRRLPRKPSTKQQDLPLLSSSTVKKHFVALTAMLQEAVYRQRIPINPAHAVRPPSATAPEVSTYGNDAMSPVLAALEGYDTMFRVLVLLARTSGARRGELIALEWRHLDLDAGVMMIAQAAIYEPGVGQIIKLPKSRRSIRQLPLTPDMVTLLKTWRDEQAEKRVAKGDKWRGGDYVFTTRHGTWLTLDYANRKLARFLERNKLPEIRLHGLRHTVATQLLANGLPLADTADFLGHAQRSTTLNFYAHPLADNKTRAAEIIAATFPPKIPPNSKQNTQIEHKNTEDLPDL
jgi:integrase